MRRILTLLFILIGLGLMVLGYLSSAIMGHDLRGVNSTNTLAVLYFSYQILLA